MSTEPPTPVIEPPQRPWKKGIQDSYSMVTLEVEVCRDEHGRVFSGYRLQDDQDRKTVLSWPGGGMEMMAFGLLTEAARREALFGVILKMSKDKEWIAKVSANPEAKEEAIGELVNLLRVQVNRTMKDIAKSVVEEALGLVQNG